MVTILDPKCAVCASEDEDSIKKCARCRNIQYCSPTCQRADWRAHKSTCHPPQVWYDAHRRCADGINHEGRLELITWSSSAAETGDDEDLGWGACFAEESEDLKRKFETEYGGDEEKWYGYWPQGFRWTCCGVPGDQMWGCDHHGKGERACTCDYCRMGEPVPEDYYSKTVRAPSAKGLELRKGPDPRSSCRIFR